MPRPWPLYDRRQGQSVADGTFFRRESPPQPEAAPATKKSVGAARPEHPESEDGGQDGRLAAVSGTGTNYLVKTSILLAGSTRAAE